jgi:hypothetical protein
MFYRGAWCYPKSITNGKTLPIDSLDHVLYRGDRPVVTYYCPATGDIFSEQSIARACENVKNNNYPGTDHTPFSFVVDGCKIGYLSLDNSMRCHHAGFPLMQRLEQLCTIVNKMSCDVMFYSEACSRSGQYHWLTIRDYIATKTDMKFLLERSNSFSATQEAFGLACFAKSAAVTQIEYLQSHQLLEKTDSCCGSVCLVLKLADTVMIACHLPFDLSDTEDNNTVRAVKSLLEFINGLDSGVDGRVLAFGDMNTIEGPVTRQLEQLLSTTEWKLTNDQHTFYAGCYGWLPDSIVLEELEM